MGRGSNQWVEDALLREHGYELGERGRGPAVLLGQGRFPELRQTFGFPGAQRLALGSDVELARA